MANETNPEMSAQEKADNFKNDVVKTANDNLETKATELTDEISKNTKSIDDVKTENISLQKQLDEMKNQAPAILKAAPKSEMAQMIREKADEIANLRKGDRVSLELKDWGNNANGVASAPYGDERVSDIKYDPNFMNRIRQHLLGGTTSQSGAIRHTFETAETDSTGNKAKGASATQSSVTLTDVHTPIQTIFNVLTLPQEQLDDIAMVESFLSTRLMGNLMDVEDVQLLRGNGTSPQYSGLADGARSFANAAARETYIGSIADSFGAAATVNLYDVITAVAAGMANENYVADKCFLNPIDYYALVLTQATTGEYKLHQTVSAGGEFMTIWNGVQIVKSPAQVAGVFTLVDSKQATQYWTREGANIEFGMNEDDFASNNISVRATLRGALTNYKAKGIVSDTIANFRTAISNA